MIVPLLRATGNSETPDTTAVTVIGKDSSGNVTEARGTTVPTNTETGFAKGCDFVDTDETNGTHSLYVNIGDETSCEFDRVGTVDSSDIEAGALSADATGRAIMATDFFNTATIAAKFATGAFDETNVDDVFAAGAINGSKIKDSTVGSGKLVNPQAFDAGSVMRNVLRVANDVVEAQTVTIGSDVYEVEIVNTDSTDNTQGGDFNNTTNPLTVTDYTTNYPNASASVGDLIRVENEIMRVTGVAGADVTLARGVSGTTVATHADALDIFNGDGIAGGSTVAVGLVATLTPAAFTPALVDDINNSGSESVVATELASGAEMLLESADAVGGSPAASATATACSETLAGANNEWATATLVSGKAAGVRELAMLEHTVDATEVALTAVRIPLPFTPSAFLVQAYDTNGVFKEDLTDQITISSNRIEYDFNGATNLAATDVVRVLAWD